MSDDERLDDPWCGRLVLLAAAVGVTASLAGLVRSAHLGGADLVWLAAMLLLLGPPFMRRRVMAAFRGRREWIGFAVIVILPVPAFAVLAQRSAAALLPALLLEAQLHATLRRERDLGAAASLALTGAQLVVATEIAPHSVAVLLLVLGAVPVIAATALLHGRILRRRAQMALSRSRRGAELPPERPEAVTARLRAAALVALAAVAVAFLLHGGIEQAARDAPPEGEGEGEDEPDREPSRADLEARRRTVPNGSHPQPQPGRGGQAASRDEFVMEVRPADPVAARVGEVPLYLRTSLFDTWGTNGVAMSNRSLLPEWLDAEDGDDDGWIQLEAPRRAGRRVELSLHQRRLPFGEAGGTMLVHPGRLHAVEAERLQWDADRMAILPDRSERWVECDVVVSINDADDPRLEEARSRRGDDRYVQVPTDDDLELALVGAAYEILSEHDTPIAKVRALQDHFADFDYKLEAHGLDSQRRLRFFLDDESGHATDFAATSMALLRLEGVHCRLATGFLAETWDASDGIWSLRRSDEHAWIEVWFEGIGWVPFDMTPAAARKAALSRGGTYVIKGPLAWLGMFEAWLEELPAWMLALVSLMGITLITGLLLLFRGRSERASGRSGLVVGGQGGPSLDYGRVLAALERHGYRKRVAETPMELALRVVSDDEDGRFGELLSITELFYAARYGLAVPTDDDVERVNAFVKSLRDAAPRSLETAEAAA